MRPVGFIIPATHTCRNPCPWLWVRVSTGRGAGCPGKPQGSLWHSLTRRAALDNLSTSTMEDKTWRGIIIRSIPPTAKWLPVIISKLALICCPFWAFSLIQQRKDEKGKKLTGCWAAWNFFNLLALLCQLLLLLKIYLRFARRPCVRSLIEKKIKLTWASWVRSPWYWFAVNGCPPSSSSFPYKHLIVKKNVSKARKKR
jgi:hypothetical protein